MNNGKRHTAAGQRRCGKGETERSIDRRNTTLHHTPETERKREERDHTSFLQPLSPLLPHSLHCSVSSSPSDARHVGTEQRVGADTPGEEVYIMFGVPSKRKDSHCRRSVACYSSRRMAGSGARNRGGSDPSSGRCATGGRQMRDVCILSSASAGEAGRSRRGVEAVAVRRIFAQHSLNLCSSSGGQCFRGGA